MTSAMSARMSRRVTADSKALAARTMVPRFTDEHGSSANSEEAMRMVSPGRQTQKACGWTGGSEAGIPEGLWMDDPCSPCKTTSHHSCACNTAEPFTANASMHMDPCTWTGAVGKSRCSVPTECGIML